MTEPEEYGHVSRYDESRKEAIRMMKDVNAVFATLPELDCGSCGSPTCRAFAEDVVRGTANYEDCIAVMRDKLREMEKGTKQ